MRGGACRAAPAGARLRQRAALCMCEAEHLEGRLLLLVRSAFLRPPPGLMSCYEIFRCRFWKEPFDEKATVEGCKATWGVTPRPLWATIQVGPFPPGNTSCSSIK